MLPQPCGPVLPALTERERFMNNRLYVGNLSYDVTNDTLRTCFGECGEVSDTHVATDRDTGRSRGFGFVEMASNEDGEKAIAALNGQQVGGRTINVNEARPKTERAGGGGFGRDRGGRGGGGGRRERW